MSQIGEFLEFAAGFTMLLVGFCVFLYGPMLLISAVWGT